METSDNLFPINRPSPLLQEENFVLLETTRPDPQNQNSYLFTRPLKIITCKELSQVKDCLQELDECLKDNLWVAGFLAYEAGLAWEEIKGLPPAFPFPLLWFGVFQQPLIFPFNSPDIFKENHFFKKEKRTGNNYKNGKILRGRLNLSSSQYAKKIHEIKGLIEQGATYQVNFTLKYLFDFRGSPLDLYLDLRKRQPVPYSALIRRHGQYILSFSPELFFHLEEERIETRPMKGTAPRGKNEPEDREQITKLKNCPKNQSENLMIVDLLRNDLGKISRLGTVKVTELFQVEKYPTLLQMTSTIQSRLLPDAGMAGIFAGLFPSGSVTGAPKIKTMEIIRELEKEPRGIYTGAIGFLSPQRKGVFNVAIRTVLLDPAEGKGEMGVGSGITYDSDPKDEWQECRLKTRFLTRKLPSFKLLESILWDQDYFLRPKHLKRMEASAGYFEFPFVAQDIKARLDALAADLEKDCRYKVRVLLDGFGQVELEAQKLTENSRPPKPKVCFSPYRTDSGDVFLYHKTTQRSLYEKEAKRWRARGCWEVLFQNEKGEVTEGSMTNIFIEKAGLFYTPPLECGLLPGVMREEFIKDLGDKIRIKPITKEEVLSAQAVYLTNAVRKIVKVQIEG